MPSLKNSIELIAFVQDVLANGIHLIVFNALFLIRSVVMVFCYGSLIRGLYFTNTVCPENETTDGERSSEKKKLVITFLLATVGFFIGYVPCVAFHIVVAFQYKGEYRYQPVLSSPECVSFYV